MFNQEKAWRIAPEPGLTRPFHLTFRWPLRHYVPHPCFYREQHSWQFSARPAL